MKKLIFFGCLSTACLSATYLSNVEPATAALCDGGAPRVGISPGGGNTIHVQWQYDGPRDCTDAYNIRFSVIEGHEQQFEAGGAWCPTQGNNNKSCLHDMQITRDKPYRFKVQACHNRTLQTSTCSQWGEAFWLPFGRDTCKDGFVWREAFGGDHVCVAPNVRNLSRNENDSATSRVSRTDHSFGPDTCVQGFVWREAMPNDHVCVTTRERQQAHEDNAQTGNRRAH